MLSTSHLCDSSNHSYVAAAAAVAAVLNNAFIFETARKEKEN